MTIFNSKRNSRNFNPEAGRDNSVLDIDLPRMARMVRKAYDLAVVHGNAQYDYKVAQSRKHRI